MCSISPQQNFCCPPPFPSLERVKSIFEKVDVVQHTATHCNALQHTATLCNTLQQYCYASLEQVDRIFKNVAHCSISLVGAECCSLVAVWLQCGCSVVAMCCRVLQCVAVCACRRSCERLIGTWKVLQCVAVLLQSCCTDVAVV